MIAIDWNSALIPTVSLLEIILRGTVIYFFIYFIFRVFRRDSGGLGIADVLLVVLIADASQNAMASEYKSITEGIVLIGTLAFWDWFLDWLAYNFAFADALLSPPPLLLIKHGKLIQKNLKREMISKDELASQLRQAGVEKFDEVKVCYFERDGHFSVVKKR